MQNKIGTIIYGGSFNPPTIAHVLTVKYIRDKLKPERFIVIPTKNPPHKVKSHISDEFRFELNKRVFGELGVEVSDIEYRLDGESYTYRTVELLSEHADDIHMLIGMDSYLSLSKWYRIEDVLSKCRVIVARRGGYEFCETDLYKKYSDRFLFADNPIFELSSTTVREKLANGEDIRFYVTDTAYEIINGRGCDRECIFEKR